eukprot:gene18970-biopygen23454
MFPDEFRRLACHSSDARRGFHGGDGVARGVQRSPLKGDMTAGILTALVGTCHCGTRANDRLRAGEVREGSRLRTDHCELAGTLCCCYYWQLLVVLLLLLLLLLAVGGGGAAVAAV